MSKELRIRFRHPAGDVGPQEFPDHATVQQLKSALHQSWPQGELGHLHSMVIPLHSEGAGLTRPATRTD